MYASRFTEAHQIYRKAVRDWCERVIVPNAEAFERDELTPREVFKQAGQLGFLGARFPEACGGSGGDFWYTVCWAEELARTGLAGTTMGLLVQSDMATPVIGEIGTQAQIDEFLKPALAGDRIASLGVTEPGAGSDVASIRTTARRDGDDYIIDGAKTYITNGTQADFITLAVRTDPAAGKHTWVVTGRSGGMYTALDPARPGAHSLTPAALARAWLGGELVVVLRRDTPRPSGVDWALLEKQSRRYQAVEWALRAAAVGRPDAHALALLDRAIAADATIPELHSARARLLRAMGAAP